jgi:hypothetical protein
MMLRWVFFAILAVLFFAWLFSKRLPWSRKTCPRDLRGSFGNGGVFRRSFPV